MSVAYILLSLFVFRLYLLVCRMSIVCSRFSVVTSWLSVVFCLSSVVVCSMLVSIFPLSFVRVFCRPFPVDASRNSVCAALYRLSAFSFQLSVLGRLS
jgi:hypothetical protein